ncbi:hypothetical protein ACIBHX_07300 [Nonomuraea sp. NPDC050536]|uniref:hypothetical protein n=1 Tax=Nonomuraea sp. NPDC050536 TaxID=3364366 RepID=UPI0037C80160
MAANYLVLSLALEESTPVTNRRRAHRLLRQLDAFGHGPALPMLDGSGGPRRPLCTRTPIRSATGCARWPG